MWAVMKSYGMDQKLIILIKAIYSETQLAVLVNGHLSEWFQMTVGNRQGDPLSPLSFALFLERMDKIENRENSGESVHGNRVNNLRFAVDIDIIERSNEKLQDTVDKLHERERYGMHLPVNVVKTKTMVFGKSQKRMMLK